MMQIDQIHQGDTVRVIEPGLIYPVFEQLAVSLDARFWKRDVSAGKGDVGIVMNIGADERGASGFIALVRFPLHHEVLIGIDGLEKIEPIVRKGDPTHLVLDDEYPQMYEEIYTQKEYVGYVKYLLKNPEGLHLYEVKKI